MQEYEKYGNNCMQIERVLSTWTPSQVKKHAECFFKQNLKTSSAAVKQYQESLSPNEKAEVLVKHATEQQNYWQSLSPESKVQILCNDADAHRKQCKSLPPEKKVKFLETNADAHKKKQESLSPDNKDLFVKNNTAAQNKHLKSLSPDQKAQALKINAAEQKNIESLSLLNRKVKLTQLMRLHTKENMSCSPRRKQQDSWKP
jgi:hypothetical protein